MAERDADEQGSAAVGERLSFFWERTSTEGGTEKMGIRQMAARPRLIRFRPCAPMVFAAAQKA